MRCVFLIFLTFVVFIAPIQADEMSQDVKLDMAQFMLDIKQHVNSTREPHPWVSNIVEGYITLGTNQQALLAWCEKEGFRITDFTDADFSKSKLKEFDSIQTCSKDFWIPKGWFWKYALSMSFYFTNNELGRIRARVFYKHPWY